MKFEPTLESVRTHQVPDWYANAKLGIFIHWGLYSVPAWAPHGGDIDKQVAEKGWQSTFINYPYAEWYQNTLRVGDTPTRHHHVATYGPNFGYEDFAPMFNQAAEKWNPDDWASLFSKVGARYAVLTTKHHDGFVLWPSARTSPHRQGRYGASRDIVGELTKAIRVQNMKMGLYYSGGLDWSFNETPVRDYIDVYSTIVQTPEFIEYANGHFRELIDKYAPSILWNDIGYPAKANAPELFAYYYNSVPDGVINDRWSQKLPDRVPGPGEMINPPPADHFDYTTPEYATYSGIVQKRWEACRGIGHSFGYNQNEGPDDYLSVEKLVRMFADIVSKNGNMLLDVGPMADGTIPDLQRERLQGLGAWLEINGEAIFDTSPWTTADGNAGGIDVRFTQKDDALYATLLDTPRVGQITIEKIRPTGPVTVSLLGQSGALDARPMEGGLTITLPGHIAASAAHVLKITPKPEYTG